MIILTSSGPVDAAFVSSTGAVTKVTCVNNVSTDTADLTTAILGAETSRGAVDIAAGTCALDRMLHIKAPMTLEGAGATATSLIEHKWADLLFIKAAHVTIRDLNFDTATYNSGPNQVKNPDPLALISSASYTTVNNIDVETGSGFGIRFVGPDPCYADQRTGDVISNVNATTTGDGGFAAVDVDCQNGATLNHIDIHGGILSFYQDQNVTLDGETFSPGQNDVPCKGSWFVVGPTQNISINDVTSNGGPGRLYRTPTSTEMLANSPEAQPFQTARNIVADNQNLNPACTNYLGPHAPG